MGVEGILKSEKRDSIHYLICRFRWHLHCDTTGNWIRHRCGAQNMYKPKLSLRDKIEIFAPKELERTRRIAFQFRTDWNWNILRVMNSHWCWSKSALKSELLIEVENSFELAIFCNDRFWIVVPSKVGNRKMLSKTRHRFQLAILWEDDVSIAGYSLWSAVLSFV